MHADVDYSDPYDGAFVGISADFPGVPHTAVASKFNSDALNAVANGEHLDGVIPTVGARA